MIAMCHTDFFQTLRGLAAAEEAPGASRAGHGGRGFGEGNAASAERLPLRALVLVVFPWNM